MEQKWIVKSTDKAKVAVLEQELGINPVLCQLLVQRGIETYEDARKFFRPELSHLHDPYLMKDMDKAVKRIDDAIVKNEKILIYGDYDVDGTTSVALAYTFLKDFYPHIDYYIPNRYSEGYGISYKGIDWAAENKFSLIIALDCGIRSIEEVEYASEKGVDFIICDHHLPEEEIPAAVAVLDPKRDDCNYPYKELSGCGIGFKLMQAVSYHFDIPTDKLYSKLALAAVSIASDIVPITGENRVLAYYGLKQLNEKCPASLEALKEISGLKRHMEISDVVFYLGPRINAAGRMDDAKHAVKLLISENVEDAKKLAEVLNVHNSNRKSIDEWMTEEALNMIAEDAEFPSRKTTVVHHPEWHKGVVGIVASRLIEKHYRPTIVFTGGNDIITGSARSIKGFNIHAALQQCKDLLVKFGGHQYAAGLSLKAENLQAFKEKFEEVVNASIDPAIMVPQVEIDADISFQDIQGSFFKILKQFGPFGPQNMKPVFCTKGVTDTGYCKVVGEKHLKLSLRNNSRQSINAIGFEKGNFYPYINGKPFDVCYTIEENVYQGNVSLQLNIKDLKL